MIRAVRCAVALLLACLGLVVTVSAPASAACTCRQGTLEQQVERADAVFIGTVGVVTAEDGFDTYLITASRAYQGTPERSTVVQSPTGRNECGLGELGIGTSYVFFVTGTEAPYEADSCGGTGAANPNRIDRVEAILGEGASVEPPPPPTAELTRVEESAPAGFARTAAPGAAAVLIGLLGLVVVRRLSRR